MLETGLATEANLVIILSLIGNLKMERCDKVLPIRRFSWLVYGSGLQSRGRSVQRLVWRLLSFR